MNCLGQTAPALWPTISSCNGASTVIPIGVMANFSVADEAIGIWGIGIDGGAGNNNFSGYGSYISIGVSISTSLFFNLAIATTISLIVSLCPNGIDNAYLNNVVTPCIQPIVCHALSTTLLSTISWSQPRRQLSHRQWTGSPLTCLWRWCSPSWWVLLHGPIISTSHCTHEEDQAKPLVSNLIHKPLSTTNKTKKYIRWQGCWSARGDKAYRKHTTYTFSAQEKRAFSRLSILIVQEVGTDTKL